MKAPKTQHTPGPWRAEKHTTWGYVVRGSLKTTDLATGGQMDCFVAHRLRSMEDAALIASAPDLLRERDQLAAERESVTKDRAELLAALLDLCVSYDYVSKGKGSSALINARTLIAKFQASQTRLRGSK